MKLQEFLFLDKQARLLRVFDHTESDARETASKGALVPENDLLLVRKRRGIRIRKKALFMITQKLQERNGHE